uniref:DUF1700 domain-containing protein n=1 Tax=Acetatifactor sp. TaxID=1872090 RepID=UPI0040569236
MNRTEFMRQLENLLQNISLTEREEALQYYNDYFDDAGAENEENVIEALGNPARVAENIKKDLYGSGYGDNNTYQKAVVNDKAIIEYHQRPTESKETGNKMSTGTIVLIVILCVLASPFLIGIASGIIGVLAGLIATWFILILAFGIASAVLLMALVLLVIVGIMCAFQSPLAGMVVLGSGLICGGLGILFLMLTVAMAGIATPAICRGIAWCFRQLTGKKERR